MSRLFETLVADPYTAPIPRLARELRELDPVSRQGIIASAADDAIGPRAAGSERLRVSLVKILVALLPESLSALDQLLLRRDGVDVHEVHFSIFCHVSDSEIMENDESRREMLARLSHYLNSVASPAAMAAWMAGDLLGDHWPPEEGIPTLLAAALGGRFAAGRKGALHGLSHALHRIPKDQQENILSTVQTVATRDRSAAIRTYARHILAGEGCGAHSVR